MIDTIPASVEIIAWPEAGSFFSSTGVETLLNDYDVLALYDMPGIGLNRGATPEPLEVHPDVIDAWKVLLQAGMPILGVHHAIASWPKWPGFAEILKGRFHYVPAELRGVSWPDSGYAMNVEQILEVVQPDHPVCVGLPPTFSLRDETYLCPLFDSETTVLVTTNAIMNDSNHHSSLAAVRREEATGWSHPSGSRAVAWTHTFDKSTIVYLQPGDGADAFDNVVYRRMIANSITWLATFSPRRSPGQGEN